MASSNISDRQESRQGSQLDTNSHLQNGLLLSSQRRRSGSSLSSGTTMNRFRELSNNHKSFTASRHTASSAGTQATSHVSQGHIRTIPPWLDSGDDDDEVITEPPQSARLLTPLPRAHSAQHNNSPSQTSRRISHDGYVDEYDESSKLNEKKPETGFFGPKEPVKGRKWDHARDGEPVILQSGVVPRYSPWRTYVKSSTYGPSPNEDSTRVTFEFLNQQTPGYDRPWRGDLDGANDPEKAAGFLHNKKQRRSFFQRWQHILLMHPLIPLIFRLIVLMTSIIALGLAASAHSLSNKYRYPQNPSTTMAVVVDVVALPYILYVTWDEYTGKPLGLRSPKAKIRLVLIDLFFIIFESANLSLAFAALTDADGSCTSNGQGQNNIVCRRINALCGILMVALIAWSMTFAVSIFRLVERVGGREDAE